MNIFLLDLIFFLHFKESIGKTNCKGVLIMSCYHWRHNRSDTMKDLHHVMGSKLTMVLVTGALVYLGAKTIHHMMMDD